MRLITLTWPFTFGVRLGRITTRMPNPVPEQARGRVLLFRGQGMIFSRGFGAICDRFRQHSIWAEDLRCVGDRWVRNHLLAEHATGKLQQPIILIGHSCGGRSALWVAEQLSNHGIAIDLLICIDVALPYTVAANVRQAVHLYRSRLRVYPARPLQPAAGSLAKIVNMDLDASDSVLSNTGLHHLNMTSSAAIQDWIVARVVEAI